MPNIGIVLSGAASKGAYEIGCVQAIKDYFGMESIKAMTTASSGALIAQAFGLGKIEELTNAWRCIDTAKEGKFFLSYSGNTHILQELKNFIQDKTKKLPYEHYVSIWNFTKSKVEYVPFHMLDGEILWDYLRGAIAIPFFSKGSKVDGDLLLDGAFLDNIPVYPLVDKDLDYIFCVYFDNCQYSFENREFDKKIIKLSDFPNSRMLGLMRFQPEEFDGMITYGYDYTMGMIKSIFEEDSDVDIYERIECRELALERAFKPRLTADIVLNNINVVMKKYSKRLTTRERE